MRVSTSQALRLVKLRRCWDDLGSPDTSHMHASFFSENQLRSKPTRRLVSVQQRIVTSYWEASWGCCEPSILFVGGKATTFGNGLSRNVTWGVNLHQKYYALAHPTPPASRGQSHPSGWHGTRLATSSVGSSAELSRDESDEWIGFARCKWMGNKQVLTMQNPSWCTRASTPPSSTQNMIEECDSCVTRYPHRGETHGLGLQTLKAIGPRTSTRCWNSTNWAALVPRWALEPKCWLRKAHENIDGTIWDRTEPKPGVIQTVKHLHWLMIYRLGCKDVSSQLPYLVTQCFLCLNKGGPENPKAKRQQTNLSNTDNWFISFSPLASFFFEDEHYGRIHCKFHFFSSARKHWVTVCNSQASSCEHGHATAADFQINLSFPFPSFPSCPFPSFPFFFPFLSLSFRSFPVLSIPFPSFPFLSLPFPSFPFLSRMRSKGSRCPTVRNHSQPSARLLYGRASGKFSRRGNLCVSRGRRGTSWHSDVFCNVSKVFLCGRPGAIFCDVFRRCVTVFVAGVALWTCPSSFCVAGAAL